MNTGINNILDLPFYAAENYSERVSHKTKKNGSVETKTFKDTASTVKILAAGLAKNGINPGDHAVLLGQDRKQLTALIAINEEELMTLAGELKVADYDISYTRG